LQGGDVSGCNSAVCQKLGAVKCKVLTRAGKVSIAELAGGGQVEVVKVEFGDEQTAAEGRKSEIEGQGIQTKGGE
jgi:hypothetical protein